MTVITISREWGSEGKIIAQRVAAEMAYRFVAKNSFEKILQQYGLVQLDTLYNSAPGFWARFDDANLQLISMLNKIMVSMAQRGDTVILGRGGFAALKKYPNVLHVRLQAPFALRVGRIQARDQIGSWDEAAKRVAGNDKARHTFLQAFYDVDADKASHFNLVLDTGILSIETAVAWIITAANTLSTITPTEALLTKEVEIDPILQDAIEKTLTERN